MNASLFLRIAAVLSFLYFAGHTAGIPWTPVVGPQEIAVLEAMKGHSFDLVGSNRTYWELYFGFGITISAFLLALAVVLWQLGSLARTDAARVRPIVASLFLVFAINGVLAWKYFFVIPLVNTLTISVCVGFAFFMAGRGKAVQAGVPAAQSDSV